MPFGVKSHQDLPLASGPLLWQARVTNAFRQIVSSGQRKIGDPLAEGNRVTNAFRQIVSSGPFLQDLKEEFSLRKSPMPFGRSSHRDRSLRAWTKQSQPCHQCLSADRLIGTREAWCQLLRYARASPMPFGRSSHRDGKPSAVPPMPSWSHQCLSADRLIGTTRHPLTPPTCRGCHQCLSADRLIGTCWTMHEAMKTLDVTNAFRQIVSSGRACRRQARAAHLGSPMPFGRSSHRDDDLGTASGVLPGN